jgi:hypothetical protein
MSRKKIVAVILAVCIIVPAAFIGLFIYQMSSLQVDVEGFGVTPTLQISVGLRFSNPTFLALNISKIYVQLYIEDQYALDINIENLLIPPGKTERKDFTFSILEALQLYNLMLQASDTYGGEIKMNLRGEANIKFLFLPIRIPFNRAMYFMFGEASLRFDSAEWIDSQGNTISTTTVSKQVYVKVRVVNPTRKQSLDNEVSVRVMKEVSDLFDEEVFTESRSVTVSGDSSETINFEFTPPTWSIYYFEVFIDDTKVYTQPDSVPPRLNVS